MQVFSASRTEYQLVRRASLLLVVFMFGLSTGMESFAGSSPVKPSAKASDDAQLQDTVLDAKTLEMIQGTTFEVVVKKPEIDSLKYEKALPLELIPFAFRNDKYLSLGTAFAIAPDRFVTAAHVLTLGAKSQMQGYSLRDKGGRVYPIDTILKYSSRRDFTVFTIKGQITKQFLTVNTSPRLNEKVYAVGNAYGEGVVIRDGLHTSDTPEERDGAWKWIRFSAAASPGNSGGPLLDRDGKLIGIVQRKSENENLNYALPIAEVLNAKDHLAVVDNKVLYRIDNMPMTKITDYRHDIALPKSFDELNLELIRLSRKDDEDLMLAMFAENKKDIFPNGNGSLRLLHNSTFSTYFPAMVAMSKDGVWGAYKPDDIDKATLGDNGYLATGMLGDSKYFHMRLPDNIALNDVIGDSQKFMDLFLKGAGYTRTVSTQNIKIVSMGKAQEEKEFIDSYRRKWSVKSWPIEFTDRMLVMMVLPVPDGLVGYVRVVGTGLTESNLLDMKALTDFTYVSYYGTFARWKAFLLNKSILPAAFADIQIGFEPGREFRYQSKRLAFKYPSSLMKVTDSSDLQLGFTFFRDGEKVVWDVSKIVVGEDKGSNVSFAIVRENNPPKNIGDEDMQYWEKLANLQHPFNHNSYFDDGKTIIGTVLSGGGRVKSSDKFLYSVVHVADGVIQSDVATTRLDSFVRGMELREGTGRLAGNLVEKSTSSKN
jgi:hypothetical protein